MTEAVDRRRTAPGREHSRSGAGGTLRPSNTNRGVGLTTSIHWLRGTNPGLKFTFADALSFLTEFLGKPDPVPSGLNGYNESHIFPTGCRLMVNRSRPDMGWCFDASGRHCEELGFNRLQYIYFGLQLRARRIDLAVDGCGFTPHQLYDHWLRDEVRTDCLPLDPRFHDNIKPGFERVRSHRWTSSPTGDCLQMGSRQSTSVARCYDQRETGTRFELELKAGRAELTAPLVFEGAGQLPDVVVGLIQDFVDFVDPESDTNRSRCAFLPFWGNFIEGCKRLTVYLEPRKDPTLPRIIDWLDRQVAVNLAVFRETGHSVEKLIRFGKSRFGEKHLALIASAGSDAT